MISTVRAILLFLSTILFIFGLWLFWDLTVVIVTQWTKPEFATEFTFPSPLYLVTATNWSFVADLAIIFAVAGFIGAVFAALKVEREKK